MQRIREAERDTIFNEYSQKLHDLVNGTVQRYEQRNMFVDLGKTEALLPLSEQVPRENFRINDRILAYVLDVRKTNKGPLVVLSREGKGRGGMLLTDQLWLWARGFEGGGPHVDLMRRMAHWLMKEPELEEEALRATASGHEILVERQSLKDETPPVTVTAPSGAREEIALEAGEPGLSRARFKAKEMGLYRFENGGLTALVNVGPANPREFREVASTPEKLRPLASATGGTARRLSTGASDEITMPRIVELRDANMFGGADWIGVKRGAAGALKGVEATPLGIGLSALLALLGAILFVWTWEGRR